MPTINGTEGADSLTGSGESDIINGFGGGDYIEGGAGSDTIDGGTGIDFIEGGAGDDTIYGGADDDTISGGAGADTLYGQGGNDSFWINLTGGGRLFVYGGAGNDTVHSVNGGGQNQAVTIDAGIGNDLVYLAGFATGNIVNLGDGDDQLTWASGSNATVTLGAGADRVLLNLDFTGSEASIITDFQPGADSLSFENYLAFNTQNWDGATNPFGSGHLRLIQSGADTLMQLDSDGGGDSYATIVVFQNVAATAFTAADFGGWPTDGSSPPGATIDGSEDNDTLEGTIGADTINGLGGNDTINGGVGDDTVYGGLGDDMITGGAGADRLYGQGGNDYFSINLTGGGRLFAYGGAGNDTFFSANGGGPNQAVTIDAGVGNDTVSLHGFAAGNVVNLGDGDDIFNWGSGSDATVTLGDGADVVTLEGNFGGSENAVITDYQPGVDSLSLDNVLSSLSGWDGSSNPFASGYLRLVETVTGTLLQRDYNGGHDSWVTVLVFQGVAAAAFMADDFGGWPPDGSEPVGANIAGTDADDTLEGTLGGDEIHGLGGNDTIDGDAGSDTIYGDGGNDVIQGGVGDDTIFGGADDDMISGGAGADRLYGQDGNDSFSISLTGGGRLFVYGGAGNDTIYSANGGGPNQAVTIDGGIGNDVVSLHGFATGNVVNLGDGDDTFNWGSGSNATVTLGAGADAVSLEGNFGGSPHSVIVDYQPGVDSFSLGAILSNLYGWSGSTNPFEDGYFRLVERGSDTFLEFDWNGGGDAFQPFVTFRNVSASAFSAADFNGHEPIIVIEPGVTLTGTEGDDDLNGTNLNDVLNGNGGNDRLWGHGGNDQLDGGTGVDRMVGGSGDDIYFVDSSSDLVIELAGEGTDDVHSSASLVLRENVENLLLLGSADINATGNELANELTGNGGSNRLSGAAGIDRLIGHGGNDILDGGTGADTMRGGVGDDTYYVNDAGDLAIENAGEGTDIVYSSINYRLREHVENLTLTGSAVRGYGNGEDNRLIGNGANNILDGFAGADVMRGGLGNDTYYVDDLNDNVIENAAQGIDSVYSSVSFALASNVENLTLTGSTAVRATGNSGDNRLVGNDEDNILNGGLGADVMRGGLGNDSYFVDDIGDNVVEDSGAGRDRVYTTVSLTLGSNVEDIFLRGSNSINATGNSLDNVVRGNSAANVITGARGADDLQGGGGADTFVFDDPDFGGFGASICDRIIDFSRTEGDIIDLGLVDANVALSADQAFAFLGTASFTGTAGELRYQQAGGNTYVYGDTDGDGAADFMIRLDGAHTPVGGDFIL